MRLHYDARHRLTRVQRRCADGSQLDARYTYDALSRRIRKDVSRNGTTQTTRYGWDGDRLVAEETDTRLRTVVYEPGSFVPLLRVEQARGAHTGSAGSEDADTALDHSDLQALRELLQNSPQPLPQELAPSADGMQIQFFHTDHLGTPLRMTDTQGRELWRARNDDWGAVREELGETDQPIRFQGQWEDGETGFCYNRHRYLDMSAGRYSQTDPIGLEGGVNAYAYVNGNPITLIDPLGLSDRPMLSRPPSFFTLTTFNAARRDVGLDESVRNGHLTRTVTMPATGIALAPSALALAGTLAKPAGTAANPPKLSHLAPSLRHRPAALFANPSILADFA